MRQDYEERLKNQFSFVQCEVECGDGWFGLLFVLCFRIQKYLSENNISNYKVIQIKEKFGTLRFYDENSRHEIDEYVRDAEAVSEVTCEHCGNPGTLRSGNWVMVLCDDCERKTMKGSKQKI